MKVGATTQPTTGSEGAGVRRANSPACRAGAAQAAPITTARAPLSRLLCFAAKEAILSSHLLNDYHLAVGLNGVLRGGHGRRLAGGGSGGGGGGGGSGCGGLLRLAVALACGCGGETSKECQAWGAAARRPVCSSALEYCGRRQPRNAPTPRARSAAGAALPCALPANAHEETRLRALPMVCGPCQARWGRAAAPRQTHAHLRAPAPSSCGPRRPPEPTGERSGWPGAPPCPVGRSRPPRRGPALRCCSGWPASFPGWCAGGSEQDAMRRGDSQALIRGLACLLPHSPRHTATQHGSAAMCEVSPTSISRRSAVQHNLANASVQAHTAQQPRTALPAPW